MAMTQTDFPSVGATTWTDDIDIRKDWIIGHINIGLTNFDNDSLPAIAQGSKVEIGGAYFVAASDQAVGGSASASTVNYIYIETNGDVVWSTTAPTWDDTKSGWYNGTNRAVARVYRDGSSNYIDKYVYSENQISSIREVNAGVLLVPKVIEIGDWDMDGTGSVNIAHGLDEEKIRSVEVVIRQDLPSTNKFHLDHHAAAADAEGNYIWGVTNIVLGRFLSGAFDTTDFEDTGFNRGWVTIWYDPS